MIKRNCIRFLTVNNREYYSFYSNVGDNGRTYDYIVKYGEDLRQDQRIQQVFDLCNRVLRNSGHQDFRPIRTYSVVPFSSRLGIIGFVPETTTYKILASPPNLKTALPKYAKRGYFVASAPDFVKVVGKADKNTVFRSFVDNELDGCGDLVKSFKSLSSGPEGFFYLRRNFILSHAQVSLISW